MRTASGQADCILACSGPLKRVVLPLFSPMGVLYAGYRKLSKVYSAGSGVHLLKFFLIFSAKKIGKNPVFV
jgi:hypothetical protein